ncbi:MAG: hypothetical protein WAV16_00705 [Candidatus Moraniibacteriota bacterium]
MSRMMPHFQPSRTFKTAEDRRNCFYCLLPMFIEQMDNYQERPITDEEIPFEARNRLMELVKFLREELFLHQGNNPQEENFFRELTRLLKIFREGPVRNVGPNVLTYVNFRLELLIKLAA